PPWKAIAALAAVAVVTTADEQFVSAKFSAVAPLVAPTVFIPVALIVGNVTVVVPAVSPFTAMVQVVELIPPIKLIVPSEAAFATWIDETIINNETAIT
ncbi:hypothetical protein, partial [Pseudomonas carnis]|uniref:hypothetical protein n=2 Tax=Pseudomonas TaxID=286 RepID=UPI001F172DAC